MYLAGRSEDKANAAIDKIKAAHNTSSGELRLLYVSLDDLSTIKPAVESFQTSESRLDVLFNNAGVSNPPPGSTSAQNHELQMAPNCLGPYLFTQLLLPTLMATAKTAPAAAVRVMWTSSIVVDFAPQNGMSKESIGQPSHNQQDNYTASKTGNWFLAAQLADHVSQHGILSVTVNPGNLSTDLTRHMPRIVPILVAPLLYKAVYGAYSELWAGLSQELGMKDGGGYVVPWGRRHPSPRKDLVEALVDEKKGGTGTASRIVEWCKRETEGFR